MKKVLLTGAAGFIGYHTSEKLISQGFEVFGVDNLVAYYDVGLKLARLKELGIDQSEIRDLEIVKSRKHNNFKFLKLDLVSRDKVLNLFRNEKFDVVIHLAAQAGVRESLKNPFMYIDSNINGLITILEGCRHNPVEHLVFASSSSVYGNNKKVPFSESDKVDEPVSLYAATKKAGELLAYSYAHLYKIPITALRFFTVYGPWGRPDMAYYKFTDSILNGKEIEVYNNGELYRDFTYIDDVVEGIFQLLDNQPSTTPPYALFNIGNSSPVNLMDFINIIETYIGQKAIMKKLPMQPGDVDKTYADVQNLEKLIDFKPITSIEDGLKEFITWYLGYIKKAD